MVDTSDPLIARDIPTCDESLAVIRFRRPEEHGIDFCQLLDSIQSSWMSRRNTLVVPGGKMYVAMKMILTPIIARMMEERKSG